MDANIEQVGIPPEEENTSADGPGYKAQTERQGGEVQRQGKVHLWRRLGRRGSAHQVS